jgi:hypothetical protein
MIRTLPSWLILAAALASGALPGSQAWGQNTPAQPHPMIPQPLGPLGNQDDDAAGPNQDEQLLRVLNAQRQKSLVADTDKLLRLANELNAEIARTGPAALTPDQLHKLAEIEKLARSVREKMATSVRGTQPFELPFQPPRN